MRIFIAMLAAFTSVSPVSSTPSGAYAVDAANSRVRVHVGKAGAFSFMGHTHEVMGRFERGSIEVEPSDPSQARVHLAIATASLKVSPEGEPPADVPKVQEAMAGDKVLAADRFPQVIFDSTAVEVLGRDASGIDLNVAGRLTIRGVTNPITARVHAAFAGGALTASGRFTVKQTAYGITPIRVAGVVAVKDALDVEFTIVARRS